MDVDDELLAAAVEISGAAGRLAAQRFQEGVPVRTKADGTAPSWPGTATSTMRCSN